MGASTYAQRQDALPGGANVALHVAARKSDAARAVCSLADHSLIVRAAEDGRTGFRMQNTSQLFAAGL
jgi:hypothetical protein